ncbi:type II toxin-antitoxin system VapC family toxin [bacterium]|nr:MAG: type II toxin-antitoxin system VapC family toxin [bacterium]
MLPVKGVIALDTAPLIYLVERHSVYAARLTPLWHAAARGEVVLIISELAVSEALVLPIRQYNKPLIHAYELILELPGIRVEPLTWPILRHAAELRAGSSSLKMPDAIHIATADLTGCDAFITNDKTLRNVAFPEVVIVDDLEA